MFPTQTYTQSTRTNNTNTQGIAELGHTTMTEVQARTIPPLLQGRDVLGAAKTGAFGQHHWSTIMVYASCQQDNNMQHMHFKRCIHDTYMMITACSTIPTPPSTAYSTMHTVHILHQHPTPPIPHQQPSLPP